MMPIFCSRCHGTGKSPKYDAPCADCVSLGICPKCSEKLLRTSEAYYVCTACNSGLIAVPKHDPAKAAAQVDEFLKNAQKIIARGDRLKK